MRKCAVMLFSVSFSLLSVSVYAAGLPMLSELKAEGRNHNIVLAQLIEESIAADPSGNGVLPGSECTTPNHFLKAIQEYVPGARLESVSELPAYIRSLRLRVAPQKGAVYRMSRIIHRVRDGKSACSLDLKGWTRPFRSGEMMYYDANLGAPVLAGDCRNVIGERVDRKDEGVSRREVFGIEDPYFLRVRYWAWGTIPVRLQQMILKVLPGESDETYKVNPAVSRDLGPLLYESWRRGEATTVDRPVTAIVYHPLERDGATYVSTLGEHPGFPNLTYWEMTLPRSLIQDGVQFGVLPFAPPGCAVVYPRAGSWLDTMPDELWLDASARDDRGWKSKGMNLNAIINCSGKSEVVGSEVSPAGWRPITRE